jgi:type II pantothenate kinase
VKTFSGQEPVIGVPEEGNMIIGIDIGGTTTDIVGYENGNIDSPLTVKADDPVTSAAGALGRYVDTSGLPLSEIEDIRLTGVGAYRIGKGIFGLPVTRIDEFQAIGLGGAFLSGKDPVIIASMGTGTAIVEVSNGMVTHLGGTGVGGGTLMGLSKKIFGVSDIDVIVDMAYGGNLATVDLTVGDIASRSLSDLPEDATASNFGKMSDKATNADTALAIINLVCQTVGVTAMSAGRASGIGEIVLTGRLTKIPQAAQVFTGLTNLYGITFIVPQYAEFATAIGAALAPLQTVDSS